MVIDSSFTVREQLKMSGLQEILDLKGITEIAINKPYEAYYDRGNGWEIKNLDNLSYDLCFKLAKALATFTGLSVTLGEKNPLLSVILPDGERGQIAVSPATAQNVVSMTFRKPSTMRFTLLDYENTDRFKDPKSMNINESKLTSNQKKLLELKELKQFSEFFKQAVLMKMNILLVGGTGSGKTTVMKAMVDEYPKDARIFTIEDVHELDLPLHHNHVHLFYKEGGINAKELIKSCMRMKPDHVLLAEIRGDEAWTYLEMLNTGHEGSITTIHANDCYSSLARLAGLVKQSDVGKTLEYSHILRTVKSSIDVIAFFKNTRLKELYFEPEIKNKLLMEG